MDMDRYINIGDLIKMNEDSEIMDVTQLQALKDELKEMAYKQEVQNRIGRAKDFKKELGKS